MKPALHHSGAMPVFSCSRRQWLQLVSGAGISVGGSFRAEAAEPDVVRRDFSAPLMATSFRITTWAEAGSNWDSKIDAAFKIIARLNTVFSDYEPNSEISRLSRSGTSGMEVSGDLWKLLRRAREIAELTDGAFDFTCGHLSHLWRRAIRRGKLPPEDRLEEARHLTDWRQVEFDEASQTVRLCRPGMLLDVGGIAKGYAADAALKSLRESGLPCSLVTAGGDLAVGDPPPASSGWAVSLRTSDDGTSDTAIEASGAGISTSGDLHQFVDLDGTRYSHIVSPKTGLGLSNRVACSVIAPDATTSDAMATACCVAGRERMLEWTGATPNLEARLVEWSKDGPEVHCSPGFPRAQ